MHAYTTPPTPRQGMHDDEPEHPCVRQSHDGYAARHASMVLKREPHALPSHEHPEMPTQLEPFHA